MQMEPVRADHSCHILNSKSVLYESEMNKTLVEVDKKQIEKKISAVQQFFSPDGIREQKGLCNYTIFCCHMNV